MTSVRWEREAIQQLLAIARTDYRQAERINDAVFAYAGQRRGNVRKLRGYSDRWRLRVAEWRIVFELSGDGMLVVELSSAATPIALLTAPSSIVTSYRWDEAVPSRALPASPRTPSTGGYTDRVTTRERLYDLIDDLPDDKLDEAEALLEEIAHVPNGKASVPLEDAPLEDELPSEEEERAVEKSRRSMAAGTGLTDEALEERLRS